MSVRPGSAERTFPGSTLVDVAEDRSPSVFVWIGSLTAALLVAIATTYLSAATTRAETLRQERRTAYADFIGTAGTCQSQALVTHAEIIARQGLIKEDVVKDYAENVVGFLSRHQDCYARITAGEAKVALLTTNEALERSAHELVLATIGALAPQRDDQETNTTATYINALSRFQVRAERDVDAPLIGIMSSAYTIPLLALGIWVLVAGGLGLYLRSLAKN